MTNFEQLWTSGVDPSSFTGSSLFHQQNPTFSQPTLRKNLLPSLITYQKFKAAKRPRIYNPYFVYTKRTVLQADLIFMKDPRSMVRDNRGFQYILIMQDIFSRKIWAQPLKTKTGRDMLPAMTKILNEMRPFHEHVRLVIDRGTEFLNPPIKNLLRQHQIRITHPSDGHASHVERANLSLQRLLYQKMTQVGGRRIWHAHLPQMVRNMNNRYHRIIRMTPEEAELPQNWDKVNEAMSLYRQKALSKKKKKNSLYKLGDIVRIKKMKNVFSRGYLTTFTDEVFRISRILDHLPITMYEIEEWDGTPIYGSFYPEEFSLVNSDVFVVERVLRRRVRNGVREAYVKWEGFPSRYNSWTTI